MSATIEAPHFLTIGEVMRQLEASGLRRSGTTLRKFEARGVVSPIRALGQDRRLYTQEDVERLKTAIRDGYPPLDAA